MLWLSIDRQLERPLTEQIYTQIKKKILQAELKANERLPSTRQLAQDLCVSRNITIEAYERLMAEGYIETRQGSGTYVSYGAHFELNQHMSLSDINEERSPSDDQNVTNFRSGIPDLRLFPRAIWAKLTYNTIHDCDYKALSYSNPEGLLELREQLVNYLLKVRGVQCHSSQIVITSGATQALSLVAKLLLSKEDQIIMEDPITEDIQSIFSSSGAIIQGIPVDHNGLQTDLIKQHERLNAIFVTPSHQFPLGSTLPIQRRIHLIHVARAADCYIVEDDYDSEFRHEGAPVSSLQGLDPTRVIYVGSFSKILSPALRIGYLVLPQPFIQKCREYKWFSDLHTPSVEQLTLARFIEKGYLERHILKMKKVYRKRRDLLIHLLHKTFPNQLSITGHSTGLHLIAEWHDLHFSNKIIETIRTNGVYLYPVEDHSIEKGHHTKKVIFGYGHLNEEEIHEGIRRLSKILNEIDLIS
ncbi:PLP-dependent aminotransferase family protein [Halalkalibacter sp. APA_J-10(15)]|uniref:MocR-like pyridoxine biosynthesis transcription factor PdxR n=1 Tax=Halalkalibacter sp. APA_J-10(15) TaxID=2933805 RepID=UPI001FF2760E|nr:PLP-dependent aminotransferase family protein [Halalkalibacter sp. APA_J-10(15)]MCK0471757.1 PLP-dependent aminotransferase family protein [Halalkalibacter sp. APA_J-10(15)]